MFLENNRKHYYNFTFEFYFLTISGNFYYVKTITSTFRPNAFRSLFLQSGTYQDIKKSLSQKVVIIRV